MLGGNSMDFLEKINYLMKKHHLNKSTLSKACNIPYTTIDGWYKRGYEGLKLPTLKKLSDYFNVSLDYWADDTLTDPVPRNGTSSDTSENNLVTDGNNSATMLNKKDENDIAKRLENTMADLDADEALMFSGEPLDEETRELLKASLENSIRIAKINAKQKFTPKKYRNNNE